MISVFKRCEEMARGRYELSYDTACVNLDAQIHGPLDSCVRSVGVGGAWLYIEKDRLSCLRERLRELIEQRCTLLLLLVLRSICRQLLLPLDIAQVLLRIGELRGYNGGLVVPRRVVLWKWGHGGVKLQATFSLD